MSMFRPSEKQLQEAREVGKHLRYEIRLIPDESRLELKYIKKDETPFDAKSVLDQWGNMLAQQHYIYFGMEGEIVHVD